MTQLDVFGDQNTDADSDTETDSGEEDFLWNFPKEMTWDEAVDSAIGSSSVQIVETDFDISGVDLTEWGSVHNFSHFLKPASFNPLIV